MRAPVLHWGPHSYKLLKFYISIVRIVIRQLDCEPGVVTDEGLDLNRTGWIKDEKVIYATKTIVWLVLSSRETTFVAFVVTTTQIRMTCRDLPRRLVTGIKSNFERFTTEIAIQITHKENRAVILLAQRLSLCNDVSHLLSAGIIAAGHCCFTLPPQMGIDYDKFLSAFLHLENSSRERLRSTIIKWQFMGKICRLN